ncbi:MAG: Unknown protein [uncultured Campylobacterales bacterium]|uniref:O-antigen ligase-related domain-containing protein n=1 Tax=uncultured Campylobacterales bacterium TaxID=352960 RepID=A0A6S6T7W8_9BACT|nr:MAG: Unknown protein [uncultured Campylobacterales bacterium]
MKTFIIENKNKINYNKVYFYSILLFAFCLPLSRAGISFFSIFLPLIWFIEGDIKAKFKQIYKDKVLFSLVLLVGYYILSILWSENYTEALGSMKMYFYLCTLFVIATSLKKENIFKVISAFLLGMFVSEVIAYGVFFEFWEFKHATPKNPSPFMVHIAYSVFMAFTSLLILNKIISNKYKMSARFIYIIFFLTITGNLFLANGRTGQVAFIVGIVAIFIVHYRVSIKSIFFSLILISTLLFSFYTISNTFKVRVNEAVVDIKDMKDMKFDGSWGVRVAYWITTFNVLKEKPFGSGIGDYKVETKKELSKEKYNFLNQETKKFMSKHHPHNQYLLLLLQNGVFGIMLFLYFLFNFFTQKINNSELKELSIIFGVIYCVGFMAEPLLIKQFTVALFALFVGIFAVYRKSDYDI